MKGAFETKYPCYIILFHCASYFQLPSRWFGETRSFVIDTLLGHAIAKVTMIRIHKLINKEQSTVPDLNCFRPVTAIATPMKTHSPADHTLLESRVSAIQPAGGIRMAHAFCNTTAGEFGARSAVKAVPARNQCTTVTFLCRLSSVK